MSEIDPQENLTRDAYERGCKDERERVLDRIEDWLDDTFTETQLRERLAQIRTGTVGELAANTTSGTPPLIRLAALRMQLPGIYQIAHSLTLDELREFKPHTRRMVMILEGTLDHYFAEEKRQGRPL